MNKDVANEIEIPRESKNIWHVLIIIFLNITINNTISYCCGIQERLFKSYLVMFAELNIIYMKFIKRCQKYLLFKLVVLHSNNRAILTFMYVVYTQKFVTLLLKSILLGEV